MCKITVGCTVKQMISFTPRALNNDGMAIPLRNLPHLLQLLKFALLMASTSTKEVPKCDECEKTTFRCFGEYWPILTIGIYE
jgi:hypothetical protein